LDPANEGRFRLITEAYFVLYNPESRALYDRGLKLSQEEDWEKSRAFFEDQLRVWYHLNPLVGRSNNAAYIQYQKGLKTGWGRQITTEKLLEIPPDTIRVLAMRHGLGFHNESLGIMSVANRDAQLVPDVGVAEAKDTGALLREVGLFSPPISDSLLIIISPFRRTLQTAIHAMGSDAWTFPTIITPLASEHSFEISVVKQGDRGSKTSVLRKWFPTSQHPQFNDFQEVDKYCLDTNCEDGKWWHHGPRWAETPASFAQRAERFRRYIITAAR
jgi:broad specificity phosphatase PhoE